MTARGRGFIINSQAPLREGGRQGYVGAHGRSQTSQQRRCALNWSTCTVGSSRVAAAQCCLSRLSVAVLRGCSTAGWAPKGAVVRRLVVGLREGGCQRMTRVVPRRCGLLEVSFRTRSCPESRSSFGLRVALGFVQVPFWLRWEDKRSQACW